MDTQEQPTPSERSEEPTTTELTEPSTEKEPDAEPKAPPRRDPEPDHEAVGIGVINADDEETDGSST